MTVYNSDRVRLEVDASDLANLVSNHSGQAGNTSGWTADTGITLAAVTNPVRGSETLIGSYTGGKVIRATYSGSAASGAEVASPSFNVSPGLTLGIRFSVADSATLAATTRLRVGTEVTFYDGLGTAIWTGLNRDLIEAGDAPWTMVVIKNGWAIQQGAATARIRFQFEDASISAPGATKITRAVYLSKLMVVQGDSVYGGVPFSDAQVWQDILGSALSVKIRRGGDLTGVVDDIDAGTLTATLLDPEADPARNARMRPGRAIRVTTLDSTANWQPLYTGRVDQLEVSYADKSNPKARPRITLTAVDAVAEARNTAQPYNYSGTLGQKVRAIMAASTLPYVTDAGAASTTKIYAADDGKVWDQLILARNSFSNAKLWIDPSGVVQCRTIAPSGAPAFTLTDQPPMSLTNRVVNASFEASATGSYYAFTPSAPYTAVQSTAWADQGTKSLLVSKTDTTQATFLLHGGATSLIDPIPVTTGDWISVRLAVKAVVACQVSLNWETWTPSPGPTHTYGYLDTVTLAAGEVKVITGRVQVTLAGATTAKWIAIVQNASGVGFNVAGPLFYLDGWAQYNSGRFPLNPVPFIDGTGTYTPPGFSYTDIDVNFGAGILVNELMIDRQNVNEPDGQKRYGPYVAGASRVSWGASSASVEVVDGTPATLAADYLARYAEPSIFPRGVEYDRNDADDAGTLVDLYNEVRVAYSPTVTDKIVSVIGVEHDITPKAWRIRLRFRPQDVTTVSVTNPAGGANSGPDKLAVAGRHAARYRSGGQTVVANTDTVIDLNGVVSDGLTWDATNLRYVIGTPGLYAINGNLTYRPGATSGRFEAKVRINGSDSQPSFGALVPFPASSGYAAQAVCGIRRLSAGDTVAMVTKQTNATSQTIHDGIWTYLDIAYLGT